SQGDDRKSVTTIGWEKQGDIRLYCMQLPMLRVIAHVHVGQLQPFEQQFLLDEGRDRHFSRF
ncbi:MAG: hypothetical protein DWI02_04515, partial [Planctomycetota bacterium]